MINASSSSSDFYFGHFAEAEDVPQSCMLSFSLQIKTMGRDGFRVSQVSRND